MVFIQECVAWLVRGREMGHTLLYFGYRSQTDLLYFHELDRWCKVGAVPLTIVFSRQPILLSWRTLLYLRRFRKVGASVKPYFTTISVDFKRWTEEEAVDILEKVSLGRVSVDVFA